MGDNNNNEDYLCHYSYGNNSYGVLRGASGRSKYPPVFIFQKTESSQLFLFPPVFFREADCWTVVGGGSFLQGRFRVRAGVKSKCVIVTELMRKSRGGQCADRTLGCMIHRRGLNTNPLELPTSPPSPPPPPASEIPTISLHYWTKTKEMVNHLMSPFMWANHIGLIGTLTCGRRQNSRKFTWLILCFLFKGERH